MFKLVRASTAAVEKEQVLQILRVFVALGIQHAIHMLYIYLSN